MILLIGHLIFMHYLIFNLNSMDILFSSIFFLMFKKKCSILRLIFNIIFKKTCFRRVCVLHF